MIRTLLLIAIGGGIGSAFRYLTSIIVQKYYASVFPLATLITNVLGCFLIGIAIAFAFVFFDKIFGALAEKSTINPFIAVWLPNVLFGILAIYLLKNAKR